MIHYFEKNSTKIFVIALLILAIAAAVFLANCIHFAPWGYSDSAAYFSAARNLSKGIGLGFVNIDGSFSPLRLHAPLFPIVLSLFAWIGADLIEVTKWLDTLFFFVFIFSSGWLFYRISTSQMGAFLFGVLLATSPLMVFDFSSMMSEPLAFVTGIPGFLLLILAVKENSRKKLVWAGILSALTVMTRYAFAAIPIAGVFVVLLLSNANPKRRWLDALIYSLISFLPMVFWIGSEKMARATMGARHLVLNLGVIEKIKLGFSGIFEVVKYWLPYRTNMIPGVSAKWFSPILIIVFFLIIIAGGFLCFRAKKKNDQQGLWLIILGSLLFLISYIIVFFASLAFSKESIPINNRLLSPLLPGIFCLLLGSAIELDIYLQGKIKLKAITLLVTAFFVVFNYYPLQDAFILRDFPAGYASPVWKAKPIFSAVSSLPEDTPILSNAPDIILFYTNRTGYFLTDRDESKGVFIASTDADSINLLMDQNCGAMVLFDPGKAHIYENKNYLVDQEQIDIFHTTYSSIYEGEEGIILIAQQCNK